jgi:N-acyl-D-amino-acid deacylase
MHAGGNEMLMHRLADPEVRDAMRGQLADYEAGVSDHHPLEFEPGLIQIVNLDTETNQPLIGRFLSEIIEETGGDQIDTVLDLIIEENGRLDVALHSMDDANVERNLRHPLSMIGSDGFALAPYGALSAGRPHPRSYGTFPRFLGRYVREKSIMSLAEGIHKCTARPAARLNLSDRGLLREGYRADVTIFSPEAIIDRATFEQPHQYPDGVQWVIVNGVVSVEAGEHTGAGAGSVLHN